MAGCDIPEPLLLYSHFLRKPSALAEPTESFLPQAEQTKAMQDASASVCRAQDCLTRLGGGIIGAGRNCVPRFGTTARSSWPHAQETAPALLESCFGCGWPGTRD